MIKKFNLLKLNAYILLIPFVILFLVCTFLVYYLLEDKDPSAPPSALLNKKIPNFYVEDLINAEKTINQNILKDKKVLINFFASWCSPCKVEHPLFLKIKEKNPNLIILGFNHKDKKNEALLFLKDLGNPYSLIGIDKDGKVAMDFGVYGLPETFVVNENGIIIFKHTGPITDKLYEQEIKKLLFN
ncbi:MAG: Thiol:disulfide interchange protein DsbE [Alphaproteobacteria bacterium MarineAlpha5_Bin11]|nr:DsbE family thiol:disulfide interchange protein [Pelagibacteraceae bacterium]PPR44651.1 MAG: Thiol:disulfide interchange protein DsbE [Alphaproteobacteria bacterium MarineAlpha5_Bin11]PPR51201.1 MAG: Thiol:disulfide interchange protein DsbE [Alphaproteobacteria bacterium MarineAlpha5_Bin10]|tara:strand:- start:1625 stop:2182 length:558 start_codon:yes stop_codon:yes gene_type:complete